MNDVAKKLSILLADTYTLYLKTQNYHWHVTGAQFKALHTLFETQYTELAEAVDEIAERLLTLGHRAPATFKEFINLKTIKEGNSKLSSDKMLQDLAQDHDSLVNDLYKALAIAQKAKDEGTANILSDRIAAHEKARWMLNASRE